MVTGQNEAGATSAGPDIDLRLVAFLRWDDRLTPVAGPVGPAPGGSAIETGSAPRLPARTWLELEAGGNGLGLVGRVVDPDGEPRPLAVRLTGRDVGYVDLPSRPQAVAASGEGVWLLAGGSLSRVGASGHVTTALGLAGVRLLGASDGAAVWVLGAGRCWYVTGGGMVAAEVPWGDPADACLVGGALWGWDPEERDQLVVVSPEGKVKRRPAVVTRGDFERPLVFGTRSVLAAVLRTLVYRDGDGTATLTMTGAGLASDGGPFLSGRDERAAWLWRGGFPVKRLPSSELAGEDGTADPPAPVTFAVDQVVGVAGGQVLVRGTGRAEQIFPLAWSVEPPFPFVAGGDGRVLVASSGPSGIAVLGFSWPPRGGSAVER